MGTLGRMRGQILDWVRYMQREFRRLRAASYFARGGKVTKTPLGDTADGHFVPIGPLTPGPPLRGDAYLSGFAKFPARKI